MTTSGRSAGPANGRPASPASCSPSPAGKWCSPRCSTSTPSSPRWRTCCAGPSASTSSWSPRSPVTCGPVLADPGQLEQVLVNLAVNARDAMPGGGTLTIDTSNITVDADSIAGGSESPPGQQVRLRVSDTGAGMTRRGHRARVRAVLHHQVRRRRNRARPGHRLRNPHPGRRSHPHLLRTRRRHDLQHHAARHRAGRRPAGRRSPTSGRPAGRPSWSSRTRPPCARSPGGSWPATAIT